MSSCSVNKVSKEMMQVIIFVVVYFAAISKLPKPTLLIVGNTVLPSFVKEDYLKDIQDLELRDTDVLVVTWPKSGKSDLRYYTFLFASKLVCRRNHS